MILFPATPALIIAVACRTSMILVGLSRGRNRLLMVGESEFVGSVCILISLTLRSSLSKGFSSSRISSMVMGPFRNPLKFGFLPFVNPLESRGRASRLECFIVC